MPQFDSNTCLSDLWREATNRLGGVDAIDLAREIVQRLECPKCGKHQDVFQPAEKIREDQLRCAACGAESAPVFLHSIAEAGGLLEKSAREIGLPKWDVLWARHGEKTIGFELAGDNPFTPNAGKSHG